MQPANCCGRLRLLSYLRFFGVYLLALSSRASAWSWIADLPDPWDQLVTAGPSRFDAHVSVKNLKQDDITQTRLLEKLTPLLRSATATPSTCFHALWIGFLTERQRDRIGMQDHLQPQFRLPNRDYLVFEGPLESAGNWDLSPETAEAGVAELMPGPQLMWPLDRSWFYASDVDSEMAGIAGSKSLIESVSAISWA